MTTRRKKIAVGCALLAALCLGCASFGAWRVLHREEVPGVVSIERTPEYQDEGLLERAWALPVATRYRGLLRQPNGSLCGPTSVANVRHSRGEDVTDVYATLDGTDVCSLGICIGGITLEELATLARREGAGEPTVLRDLTLDDFRAHMAHANDEDRRYIINFDRGPLFGFRGGHHSPIGGYLADEDLVFVLDVNRAYGPWLVHTERLFEAMDTVDSSSGKTRGLLLLR